MDPATLALTAAGLLAKKALEAAGGKAGEGAWATLGRIAETIRVKFRGDPEATEALNRLEANPTSNSPSSSASCTSAAAAPTAPQGPA
jgi:hypothetical protein